MFTGKILKKMAPHGLMFGKYCVHFINRQIPIQYAES